MSFVAAIRRKHGQFLHALIPRGRWIAVTQAASAGNLLQTGMQHSPPESVLEALMEVANLPQLIFDPARLDSFLVVTEGRSRKVLLLESFKSRFRGQHTTLNRQMN